MFGWEFLIFNLLTSLWKSHAFDSQKKWGFSSPPATFAGLTTARSSYRHLHGLLGLVITLRQTNFVKAGACQNPIRITDQLKLRNSHIRSRFGSHAIFSGRRPQVEAKCLNSLNFTLVVVYTRQGILSRTFDTFFHFLIILYKKALK